MFLETKLKPINNFVVWHKGDCNIFKNETEAMDFITNAQVQDPNIVFDGWRETHSGNNMMTKISDHDWVYQEEKIANTTPVSSLGGKDE